MNSEKKTQEQISAEAAGLEEQIYQVMFERGWLFPRTIEEVEIVEQELEDDEATNDADLLDVENLLKKLAARTETIMQLQTSDKSDKSIPANVTATEHVSQPLVVMLRAHTRQRAPAIANTLGVTAPFLSDLSDLGWHARVIQMPWKQEIVGKIKQHYPDIPEEKIWQSLNCRSELQRAAYRDDEYEREELTPERILERSSMDDETKAYWLALLEKEE